MSTEKIKRVALRQQSNYESVIPNFIMFDLDLNLHDIRIYSVINSFRINHKPCCASLSWISEQTGICARDIQRSRARLVNKGYILHFRKGRKWYFQIPSPEICTDINDFEVTDSVTPEVTDSVTHNIKNNVSSIKCSGSNSPPLQGKEIFEKHSIKTPIKTTKAIRSYVESGITFLKNHNFTLDLYLNYLNEKCSFIFLPYIKDGQERQNGFSVILKTSFINSAIKGDFEDRTYVTRN